MMIFLIVGRFMEVAHFVGIDGSGIGWNQAGPNGSGSLRDADERVKEGILLIRG
jgi:hypothetical protein